MTREYRSKWEGVSGRPLYGRKRNIGFKSKWEHGSGRNKNLGQSDPLTHSHVLPLVWEEAHLRHCSSHKQRMWPKVGGCTRPSGRIRIPPLGLRMDSFSHLSFRSSLSEICRKSLTSCFFITLHALYMSIYFFAQASRELITLGGQVD